MYRRFTWLYIGTTVGVTSVFTTLRDGWSSEHAFYVRHLLELNTCTILLHRPDLIYDAKKWVRKAFTSDKTRRPKPRVLVLGSGWAALSLLERLDADLVGS